MNPAPTRCWIRVKGQDLELGTGATVLGRHDSCDVVLDDPLVSRRHAVVSFDGASLTVEDLGSVNGVLLNGRRVQGAEPLRHGDEIGLGNHALQVNFGAGRAERDPTRWGANTLNGGHRPSASEEHTAVRDGEAFETLIGVVSKLLDRGRVSDAERILKGPLEELLRGVLAKERVDDATLALAATTALRLAAGTRRGSWVDYVFSLYTASGGLLPAPIVERLYDVVRVAAPIDPRIMREYLGGLHERQSAFGPTERFLLRRLDGLKQLLAMS